MRTIYLGRRARRPGCGAAGRLKSGEAAWSRVYPVLREGARRAVGVRDCAWWWVGGKKGWGGNVQVLVFKGQGVEQDASSVFQWKSRLMHLPILAVPAAKRRNKSLASRLSRLLPPYEARRLEWDNGTVRGHCAEPARPPVSFRYPYSRLLISQLLSLMHHTRRRTRDVYTLAIVVFRPVLTCIVLATRRPLTVEK